MAYTAIDKPSDYFDTKIYTGTGSNNVTLPMDNLGLLWIKNRTESINHSLFDSARGGYYVSGKPSPIIRSNTNQTASGSDITSTYGIDFGSSSSTIGSDGGGYNYNQSGKSYVGWQWRGNSSGTSVSASGGVNGYNACTHYANQDAGFSIVKYTGRNSVLNNGQDTRVTHGLGVIPKMIIIKSLDTVQNWVVFHHYNWDGCHFNLNTNAGMNCNLYMGNNNNTTSSYFNVGNDNLANKNNDNFISYVFAEKQGYSKFGNYTGNGNVDGSFIYTGFSPAFVMVKRTDASGDWAIIDNKRNTFNVMNKYLKAQATDAESTDASFDIDAVSNGFKLRYNNGNYNASGGNYIYMVFAENPFVTSSGVPATAR